MFAAEGTLAITASVLDNNLDSISVYPNPAVNTITITSNFGYINKFKIINVLGQTVINGSLSSNQIDVSNLKRGVYLLQLKDKTLKFMKR